MSPTADVAARFVGLGHAYRSAQWVFRNYESVIGKGRVVAVLGPNGCGKSTLLHIVLGVLEPSEGQVTVHGRMAFVPQLFRTAFSYSVLDMVLMGRARRIGLWSQPSKADIAAAMDALGRFDIAVLAERPFDELSGGQRQLVILARALVAEAEILVLDEPCSALDLQNQALILDRIARLADDDGLTVLFTTHSPQHALAVADDVLLMMGDRDLVVGHPDAILTESNLERLYGVPIRRSAFADGGQTADGFSPMLPVRRRRAGT